MMRLPTCLLVLFLATCVPTAAAETARKVFDEWLEAFNSGDAARWAAFDTAHSPPNPLAKMGGFRSLTGGFTVLRVEKEEPTSVVAIVQEKGSDAVGRAALTLADEATGKVATFEVRRIPRPADLALPRMPVEQAIAATAAKVDEVAASNAFSGVFVVTRAGKTVLEKIVGEADREAGKPVTLDTQFRLGSMNKMFTSVAILQLVDQGKIGLDDPVGKLLPAYPNGEVAEKVTVRHLLTHTGGTGDIFGPEYDKHRLTLKSLSDYADLYASRSLDQVPGSAFKYSNYGFILLGLIIEKVRGLSYYDYVERNIFLPAGMRSTASLPETETVPNRARGYMLRDGKWISNAQTLPWRGTSAGGGYSTAADLLRFAQALQ